VIRPATTDDVPVILELIRALAVYEKLEAHVVVKGDDLREHLFGERPFAECILAEDDGATVGFALFFHNYSTFRGRPGIYLEDLFVRPECRGRGHGKALFAELARIAVERGCDFLQWSVLDWNTPSIGFYVQLGAVTHPGWLQYRLTEVPLRALACLAPGTFAT
jgi:GNAT superfamily N-acetyltransferase